MGELEFPSNYKLTNEEIFLLYNDRIIIDKNGWKLLVKDGKYQYPKDNNSLNNLKKKNIKYRIEVRINQPIWDWKKMQFGKYDGGVIIDNQNN